MKSKSKTKHINKKKSKGKDLNFKSNGSKLVKVDKKFIQKNAKDHSSIHKMFTKSNPNEGKLLVPLKGKTHHLGASKKLNLVQHEENFTNISKKLFAPEELVSKFSRGEGLKGTGIKTHFEKVKLLKSDKNVKWAAEQAARSTILLTEDPGFIEPDDNEVTHQYSQAQISENVDVTSATKSFELNLGFGPYRMSYIKNGRYLLLGGRRGHLSAIDWVTKNLLCETNVMEQIFDVQWLHQETMFAVAQKDWVYLYDNQGIELHCVKALNKVLRMEFLPYHFLLSTGNEDGFLGWLDTSIGKMVSHFNCKQGRLNVMTQNPANAVICLGHTNGTVTMWSPNLQEPLVKMLCHKQPLTTIAVDNNGQYMVTASVDRSMRVWDLRKLSGPLQDYRMRSAVNNIAISQRGLLATSSGNIVEIYNNICKSDGDLNRPYLRQKLYKTVENLQFCPYEDVLGAGTYNGFTSLLVPGSGEPNFDAYEANPYQSKSQRREKEVKALLEKIQPEMITLDTSSIQQVDLPSLKDKLEAKKSLLLMKQPNIDLTPFNKTKIQGKSLQMAKTKKILKEQQKKDLIKVLKEMKSNKEENKKEVLQLNHKRSVLDRFKRNVKNASQ